MWCEAISRIEKLEFICSFVFHKYIDKNVHNKRGKHKNIDNDNLKAILLPAYEHQAW